MPARPSRANPEVSAVLDWTAIAHRQIEQTQYVWILDGGGVIR
jgi:hypothetical protein